MLSYPETQRQGSAQRPLVSVFLILFPGCLCLSRPLLLSLPHQEGCLCLRKQSLFSYLFLSFHHSSIM